MVTELVHRIDVETLTAASGPEKLHANDIARIRLRTAEPIAADNYAVNRHTGSFLLIDPGIGDTLTAGLIGGQL
jgi:sulfate adenylyltransferase subunit 1